MLSQNLKDKYPFLTEYFEQGLKNSTHSISHSIMFYGQDIQEQYKFAVEISRLLNCRESKNESCDCLNCNWIREGKHPAVLTISKIDNKPSDDDSKTVISVKQSQMVKNALINTSEYHRVFIFCDAEIKKVDGEERWLPLGLNQTNFHEETANSLLKIIEEPPENTTFFFLTRDKNDMLETIISRSQCFFIPSYSVENMDYSIVKEALLDYPEIERKDSLDLALELFALTKEHNSEIVLDQVQSYMLSLLKTNVGNNLLKTKILSDIKSVELAKKMINSHIQPQLAFEDMCLNLTS